MGGMSADLHSATGPSQVDRRGLNALKHGLTARRVLQCELESFEAALSSLHEEWHPAGPVADSPCRRKVWLAVRLDRAGTLESEFYAACFEDTPGGTPSFNRLVFANMIDSVGRYEMSLARGLAKTLHELERVSARLLRSLRRGWTPRR